YNHIPSNPVPPVRLVHTHMIEAAPSAVVAAEDAAHDFSVFFRHHAGRRIALQKTFHPFSGIINTADAETSDFLPEVIHLFIVLNRHYTYHSLMHSIHITFWDTLIFDWGRSKTGFYYVPNQTTGTSGL